MHPAMIEITEVTQQSADLQTWLYMVLVAFAFKTITFYGKRIPNDEPGIKGAIGRLCRIIMMYTPNVTKRDK